MTLDLHQLTKRFGSQLVLDAISLALPPLHSLALIGPSGGGKSTLLRILAGLELPDSGVVTLNGETIPRAPDPLRRYRASIGTVFQAFNLFPHLTALRNVTLPLQHVHGLSPAEADAQARALFHRFGLIAHLAKRPAELSGGQRQRVAIVRAVAIKPKLLLFDEPTSALDPEMTAEVLELIEDLRREGRDLIIVTHQIGFARHVAEHVAFLHNGHIVEHGPSAQTLDHPKHPALQTFLGRILRFG